MLIGLKAHNEPFAVIECPDDVKLEPNSIGAPDFISPGSGQLRRLENMLQFARKGVTGYKIVHAPDFDGTTHIVAGQFGYKTVKGTPKPEDLLPGQTPG